MTTDPMVTVMQHAKVLGWPDAEFQPRPEDRAYVMPLSRALQRTYRTDAHFVTYASHNGRRLKTSALDKGVTVRIDVLVMDVDCPAVHGSKEPAPDEWRVEIREKMLALRAAHPGFVYFETRGGSRIIYRQPVPYFVASAEDAQDWKRDYAITCAYLRRVFDIDADPSCADWTRLFRLPRATRDGKAAPEPWPLAGNPHNVASIWFEPLEEDREEAQKILPNAFGPKKVRDVKPEASGYCDGYGVLYHALRNRGDVFGPHRTGAYVIRCPNESNHSSGKTGDTSTILYLPGHGESLGYIHCLHAHCQHLGARDWLRCFSDYELDAAREAAGLPARGRRSA